MDPFCREQKKDSDASGIHKTTKNTPAFGTRVPERTFCVLRCERAKFQKLTIFPGAPCNSAIEPTSARLNLPAACPAKVSQVGKMAVEIVDLPNLRIVMFHSSYIMLYLFTRG